MEQYRHIAGRRWWRSRGHATGRNPLLPWSLATPRPVRPAGS